MKNELQSSWRLESGEQYNNAGRIACGDEEKAA